MKLLTNKPLNKMSVQEIKEHYENKSKKYHIDVEAFKEGVKNDPWNEQDEAYNNKMLALIKEAKKQEHANVICSGFPQK